MWAEGAPKGRRQNPPPSESVCVWRRGVRPGVCVQRVRGVRVARVRGVRGACGGVCELTRPRPGQTGDASPVWRRPSGRGGPGAEAPLAGSASGRRSGHTASGRGPAVSWCEPVRGPSQADGGQGSRAPASRSRGPGGQPTSVCVCCRARPPSTDAHAGPAPQGETPAHGHGAGASPRAATVRGADRPTTRLPATRRLSRTRHSQAGTAGGQVTATTRRRRARERGSVFRNRETDGTSPRCGSRGRRPS